MPVELDSKKSSSKASAKRKSKKHNAQNKPARSALDNYERGPELLPEPMRYLGGKHRTDHQRSKYHERFEELTAVIGTSSASLRALANSETHGTNTTPKLSPSATSTGPSPSSTALVNAFPILPVGYLARAMGLNVSNEQVTSIIELIEEDGPSSGFVDKRKLEHVIVDALLTGTLGGPTLREFAVPATAAGEEANAGKLLLERLERFTPSLCVRDDEATILRAFEAFDVDHKGYLEFQDLHAPMTTGGEAFSNDEMDEMWMAMRDPESGCIYYRDFADVLARE